MHEVVWSCHLDAPVDRVWEELQKPALLRHVAAPILFFRPITPKRFPERWEVGDYAASLWAFGVLPLGRQTIAISHPAASDDARQIRDNGHGTLVRQWDHLITLEPDGKGTRYTDRVRIEAGVLTGPVWLFARLFYAHRQRRWRRLVAAGFDYGHR